MVARDSALQIKRAAVVERWVRVTESRHSELHRMDGERIVEQVTGRRRSGAQARHGLHIRLR